MKLVRFYNYNGRCENARGHNLSYTYPSSLDSCAKLFLLCISYRFSFFHFIVCYHHVTSDLYSHIFMCVIVNCISYSTFFSIFWYFALFINALMKLMQRFKMNWFLHAFYTQNSSKNFAFFIPVSSSKITFQHCNEFRILEFFFPLIFTYI